MINRREIIGGGLGTFSCLCRAQSKASSQILGCVVPLSRSDEILNNSTEPRRYITGDEPIIMKSGNKDFDYALAQTLAKIAKSFSVLPGFAYYDDTEGPNAYAMKRVRLQNADGTVLFGKFLLGDIFKNKKDPDVVVASVCAHEFGHILQFKHGLDSSVGAGQPNVKRIELQADFFAGYFAGIRKKERPSFPAAVFAMTQYEFGDPNVAHAEHHGTSEERGKAVSEGFKYAHLPIQELIPISTAFVSKM